MRSLLLLAASSIALLFHEGLAEKQQQTNHLRKLIVAGKEVAPKNYPFFAKSGSDKLFCAAALIHPEFLLTAAHCQGAFDDGLYLYNPSSKAYDRRVDLLAQYRYPGFNSNPRSNNKDLMLLQIAEPVDDITPVPLNKNAWFPVKGDTVTAIGEGFTAYEENVLSGILYEVDLTYMGLKACGALLKDWPDGHVNATKDLLCAGSTSARSVCDGDSGGPLLSADGKLVGITSFTKQCTADETPNGFARVSYFKKWIKQTMCDHAVTEGPPNCTPTAIPEDAVPVLVQFAYDLSPEQTTWAIRKGRSNGNEFIFEKMVYAGPTEPITAASDAAAPQIVSTWIWLQPGEYLFEVYDTGLDGLSNPGGGWLLYANYAGSEDELELITGGQGDFFYMQEIYFEIESRTAPPTISPAPTVSARPTLTSMPTVVKPT